MASDNSRPLVPDSTAPARGWTWVAVAILVGSALAYHAARPDYLVDEPGHLGNIYHFLEGKPGWPESMPMLPGYHFIVAALWQLHPPISLLALARLVATACALLGLAAFVLAWVQLHRRPVELAPVLYAVLPLTLPFAGMAYTDIPALALILCAIWAQVRGYRATAAVALLVAVCLRQTSLTWAGFLVAWEWFRTDERRDTFVRRAGLMFGLMMAAVVVALAAGRLTVGAQHGNDFRFNPAALHFSALLVLVFGLPLWVRHAPAALRRIGNFIRGRPIVAVAAGVGSVAVMALLFATFRNPHEWNRALSWEGCTFTLLRNWPLVYMEREPLLRVLSSGNVVVMAWALGMMVARQHYGRELALVIGCGSVAVFTNGLVEPRYLIPGCMLFLLWLDLRGRDATWLAGWWALLSALHAPFVATGRSLW